MCFLCNIFEGVSPLNLCRVSQLGHILHNHSNEWRRIKVWFWKGVQDKPSENGKMQSDSEYAPMCEFC